ncbi:MAG: Lrp/AsnC ligand binding domain-containing protein [Candidatus Poseidoniaceae archaeon]|jgi:DNA-binding Lrp family transcriptional regulator|tara:strand:- start:147 stop:389 length:243 start_codon:yes stop_codon:yes gene_type:complete
MSQMAVGYVLINVAPGKEHQAYLAVKDLQYVVDATLLFGDHDLIVKLEADSLAIIAKAVVETIRQVPGVIDTKTLAGAEL